MRSLSGASLALVAMLSLGSLASSVGCAKVGEIRGRKAFKSANQSYQAQDYKKAAESLSASPDPADKKLGKLALQYLVSSYGPDKLNDPAKAEPVVQRMIQLEPGEPTNYFALAKIYEDAGAYDEAEKMLVQAKNAKPADPAVYMTLAGYYN